MGEIVLVRHGQANSHADNEEDYDRLSDLGVTQAKWLGQWLRDQGEVFDTILSGSLHRHRQTAESMGVDPAIDARFNEMDYFNLAKALEDSRGIPYPDQDSFGTHVPLVMKAWHAAEIQGNESFASFENRVTAALIEAAVEGRRVLCVTSGGVIAMVIRHILGLDPERLAHICLPIHNTSIHRLHIRGAQMLLAAFNATPHFDTKDRAHARTHY